MHKKLWLENLKEGNNLRNQGIDGRSILKQILKKWDVRLWSRLASAV
jgi:hypothetical protein